MRSPSGQGSKGQGLGETASPLSPELNEPQRVLGAQDRFKSLAPQNQKGAPVRAFYLKSTKMDELTICLECCFGHRIAPCSLG